MPTNAKRKELTRQKIVTMATQLYIRNGVKNTSVADIAKAANISQVTLYKYFESKQVLSTQVVVNLITEGYAQDADIVSDTSDSFAAKMRRLLNQSTSLSAGMHPDFYQYITDELSGKNGSLEAMKYYESQKAAFWGALLQQGRDAGEIDPSISNEAFGAYLDMFVSYFLNLATNADPVVRARLKKLGPELDKLFFFGLIGKES